MKALKTRLRQFDHWRRGWMSNLEPTLYRLINNNRLSQKDLVEKPDVKSILIVRNNKRIGNMYFLIPFVRQMRAQYPDAKLTLMLNQPWQGEVFANMGVDEIVYSHFSFKEIVSCLKSVFTLKKNDYDLIVAPYRSTGDAVLVSVLAGKNKVAEHHLGSDVAFTHTFQKDDDLHHTALTSLYLIKALGNTLILPVAHQIELSQEEITAGQDAMAGLYSGEDRVCAFFRGAAVPSSSLMLNGQTF
ncbi:lipopolysaccharide heptosyltransferase III [Vibrio variabilis]|uniref:Lipopolysaccharide heptosyltransferase III n=1 Tax=Vibrio variabilis TaxID=990271 RepID=A0ABQ0J4L7_9VIBR|nr:lipopolysaccharide heptosyltransferase III [Vibrio variabilis]